MCIFSKIEKCAKSLHPTEECRAKNLKPLEKKIYCTVRYILYSVYCIVRAGQWEPATICQ